MLVLLIVSAVMLHQMTFLKIFFILIHGNSNAQSIRVSQIAIGYTFLKKHTKRHQSKEKDPDRNRCMKKE